MSVKSIKDSLYPAEHLIPFVGCCCVVTSCYLGGNLKCCHCDKPPTAGGAHTHGPSIEMHCCNFVPNCCKGPSMTCCDISKADCCKISVSIFSCSKYVWCIVEKFISSVFFVLSQSAPHSPHASALITAVRCPWLLKSPIP